MPALEVLSFLLPPGAILVHYLQLAGGDHLASRPNAIMVAFG